MALINRMSRLFTADMHAVLDRLEEPETLLKQAVREMEDETAKSGERLRRLHLEAERIDRREREIAANIAQIDDQLDLCFESGEEGLARSLVKRKLPQSALLGKVSSDRTVVAAEIAQAAGRHLEQQQRLESVRQKSELLGDGRSAAANDFEPHPELAVSADDIEVAFLHEKAKRSGS